MRLKLALMLAPPLALCVAPPALAQGVLEAAPVQTYGGGAVEIAPLEPGVPAGIGVAVAAGSQVQADPYEDLYLSMREGVDDGAMIENMLSVIIGQLQHKVPALAKIEAARPGLIAELRDAIRPVLSAYTERAREQYVPAMVGVLRQELTRDDARSLAELYRSPVGIKLLQSASAGYTGDASISYAMKNPSSPVSETAVKTDLRSAGMRAFDSLDRDEQAELATMALSTPAIFKMSKLNARIAKIRVEMEKTPMSPDEQQQMAEAVRNTIQQHLALAGIGQGATSY